MAALALFGGCAEIRPPRVTDDHFFPALPEPPRVQYLRSFNGSEDFKKRQPLLDYLAGAEKSQPYEISKAFSVAAWKGRIYVTDSFGLKGLNVFDLENRRFYVLGKEPGIGEIRKPIHVFVDEEGFKYISDLVKRQVLVYSPDDLYMRSYGDGSSFLPVSCAVHGREVYILDIAKDRIKSDNPAEEDYEERRDQILVLDKETGKPLRRLGRHGKGEDGFLFASFMTIDRLGNLYVSDALNYRVVKLDGQGNVLGTFGRHGDRPGDFAQMKGIAVDQNGLIYVVDAAFQLAQVFDNAGTPLFMLGGPRAPQGAMDLPAGIWIDYNNLDYFNDYFGEDFEPECLIIVANQLSPKNRIAVYAFGKRQGLDYSKQAPVAALDQKPAKPLWRLTVLPPEAAPVQAEPPPPSLKSKSEEKIEGTVVR
ncbi:MAG: hypothetical protein HY717_10660 [Planctomycetes bacterium]|nr:hypothetical protein [Planctomycetota bacterium]